MKTQTVMLYESVCTMNTAYMFCIITETFCFFFSVLLLFRLKNESGLGNEVRTLQMMFIFYILFLVLDIVWAFSERGTLHLPHLLYAFINAFADTVLSFGCYFWYRFTDEHLQYPFSESRTADILLLIPVLASVVLDMISVFTGWLFYIDEANHYQETSLIYIQGALNGLYLLIPAVFSIYQLIRTHFKQRRSEYLCYVLYFVVIVFYLLFDEGIYEDSLLSLIVFTALLILFLVIYVDREKELLKSQKELAESRAAALQKEQELAKSRLAIMVSQIQPHFLYNTLTAIQAMCYGKAPEAEESIGQFARYLRGNLDSLSQMTPIPFRQELTHTQNYLNLETKRFGEDLLHIEYHIEAENFCIPALTLQPLAENAVRYGVMLRPGGGTVWISSAELSEAFVVTVRDDGEGFNEKMSSGKEERSHIGIANVRSRLETMCGGSLTIRSEKGCGTTAVISIPKENYNVEDC